MPNAPSVCSSGGIFSVTMTKFSDDKNSLEGQDLVKANLSYRKGRLLLFNEKKKSIWLLFSVRIESWWSAIIVLLLLDLSSFDY